MSDQPVPLSRSFSRIHFKERDNQDLSDYFTGSKKLSWSDLESESRCVILAEAGAGKTFEMRARAQHINDRGDPAFFIRIEDIDSDFQNAFEIGCSDSFLQWMEDLQKKAWFFLDSVDESRLSQPRNFERAIRKFSNQIRPALHRAKIILSSRPYAWRSKSDAELIRQYLPCKNHDSKNLDPDELHVYNLDQLTISDIAQFAEHRSTPDIDSLINELQRLNLISTAARPFDLGVILEKWAIDQRLGGRLEMLIHNIDERLNEKNSDRPVKLDRQRAKDGAQALAAALVLSGAKGIAVPHAEQSSTSDAALNPEIILNTWNRQEIFELLSRGVFDDAVYGAVRFRHREIRDLLAAEWFKRHYENGNSRHFTDSLFIREQYGEKVIPPRIRPVLPWLILLNDKLREKILEIDPNIAIEGGDPGHLPISVRKNILDEIVERISKKQTQRIHRNDSLLLIAQHDLSERVENLIIKYRENDDALFFLGRLVWQGEMTNCLPLLADIAANKSQGAYARIAATRAVMQCGDGADQYNLWKSINEHTATIDRKLFEEILENVSATNDNVDLLLASLNILEPYEEFEFRTIIRLLHRYIDNLYTQDEASTLNSLWELIKGLYLLLAREPHIDRQHCEVSSEFRWLVEPSLHAVEKLVETRSLYAISKESLSIMRMAQISYHWRDSDRDGRISKLPELVPSWHQLNDALFWHDVTETRGQIIDKSNDKIIDVWQLEAHRPHWKFEIDRFQDILNFIETKESVEDKLIAQSLAVQLLKDSDAPHNLESLKLISNRFSELDERLIFLLNPVRSEEIIKWEEEQVRFNAEHEQRQLQKVEQREAWIEQLKSNPNLVLRPQDVSPGKITNYQVALMRDIQNSSNENSEKSLSQWSSLIAEFGIEVANAYKSAAIDHWRYYKPSLRSEGNASDSNSYAFEFGLAGIEIESAEAPDFFYNLSSNEAQHILRYVIRGISVFPSWLERMYEAHQELTIAAILVELEWDIVQTPDESPSHYILRDIVYHAPWLHSQLTTLIIEILKRNDVSNLDVLRYCFEILGRGGVGSDVIGQIAELKIKKNSINAPQAFWHSLLVSSNPSKGISATQSWIESLPNEDREQQAQRFIVHLVGGRTLDSDTRWKDHITAAHLKALFLFIYQYVRIEDDIDRSSGGVYSPGLRDHAQDARDGLINILRNTRGKEAYIALYELVLQHPEPSHREWMRKLAYNRATEDSDLEPWTAEQIRQYNQYQTLVPKTHRQLYNLAVSRLIDLKSWLEVNNDSPYKMWKEVKEETVMRNAVTGWLNDNASERYTCSQEYELPNGQRPDILFQSNYVNWPVPVELKLLDNGWSGPDLCERLRNQLVGDYLREAPEGCGIMLLMWRGDTKPKKWNINGKMATLQKLEGALETYWHSISDNYPNIEAIKVVVIDLSDRDRKANT